MPTYRKLRGVHHRVEAGVKKRYGPGQPDGDVFEASESEVKPFRDTVDLIDDNPADEPAETGPVKKSAGNGKADIINPKTGEAINDEPLDEEVAAEIAGEDGEELAPEIEVVHVGGGWYDVMQDGVRLNTRSLRKDMAYEFAEEKKAEAAG